VLHPHYPAILTTAYRTHASSYASCSEDKQPTYTGGIYFRERQRLADPINDYALSKTIIF
jgi:hypothetical protein